MNTEDAKDIGELLVKTADLKSRTFTDESTLFPTVGAGFSRHEAVNHSGNGYAHDDVTTNAVEGFFGNFKRRTKSIYRPSSKQRSHRF